MTPQEIAEEIIWKGLEKETGDKVSNVLRILMDVQAHIIKWMEGERMKKEEWERLYRNRLIKGGLTAKEAEDSFQAGGHDYDLDPEMSASDELSYWGSE